MLKNEDIKKFHMPRWNELPEIDLYLDQVVTFIEKYLLDYVQYENDEKDNKIITKTMINNYVKQEVIEPPIKKKYNRNNIAYLFVICILKQVFSMNEISSLINIALESADIEYAYNSFCSLFEEAVISIFEKKEFSEVDTSNEKRYLLKSVLLACGHKIYVQNLI